MVEIMIDRQIQNPCTGHVKTSRYHYLPSGTQGCACSSVWVWVWLYAVGLQMQNVEKATKKKLQSNSNLIDFTPRDSKSFSPRTCANVRWKTLTLGGQVQTLKEVIID